MKSNDITKDKILQALTVASDISEASELAGVSRKTIYAYLKDDEFILAYRNIKRVQIRDISEKMNEGAYRAFERLLDIIDNSKVPYQVQLQACVKMLELYQKFVKLETNINQATLTDNNTLDILPIESGL